MAEGNKPVTTVRIGAVKITEWLNAPQGDRKFPTTSFSTVKTYKQGEEWKETNSYNALDLLKLKFAIEKVLADHFF